MIDVLAIGPHPDDVELSCGGWLAQAGERGQQVVVADLTRGEGATNGTPELRAREAASAAEMLGISERINLGLPDGGLRHDADDQVSAVVALLRRVQPALLVVPATQARHPDHAAAGHLCVRAAFWSGVRSYRPELGGPFRPVRVVHYPQRHEARPDFVVDVTAVYDRKWSAILSYQSQFGAKGSVSTLINHPLGLEAFRTRDRYWGASIGVEFGEPYVLGAPVPLSDPVAHFAAHPAVPVLVPSS